jgi:hypothetical protein
MVYTVFYGIKPIAGIGKYILLKRISGIEKGNTGKREMSLIEFSGRQYPCSSASNPECTYSSQSQVPE